MWPPPPARLISTVCTQLVSGAASGASGGVGVGVGSAAAPVVSSGMTTRLLRLSHLAWRSPPWTPSWYPAPLPSEPPPARVRQGAAADPRAWSSRPTLRSGSRGRNDDLIVSYEVSSSVRPTLLVTADLAFSLRCWIKSDCGSDFDRSVRCRRELDCYRIGHKLHRALPDQTPRRPGQEVALTLRTSLDLA